VALAGNIPAELDMECTLPVLQPRQDNRVAEEAVHKRGEVVGGENDESDTQKVAESNGDEAPTVLQQQCTRRLRFRQ
jgi:hypothetical protein